MDEAATSSEHWKILLGLLATVALLPEPKGLSLEDLTEDCFPASAVTLGVAESRGTRPPAA